MEQQNQHTESGRCCCLLNPAFSSSRSENTEHKALVPPCRAACPSGRVKKLVIEPLNPHLIISCSEDGSGERRHTGRQWHSSRHTTSISTLWGLVGWLLGWHAMAPAARALSVCRLLCTCTADQTAWHYWQRCPVGRFVLGWAEGHPIGCIAAAAVAAAVPAGLSTCFMCICIMCVCVPMCVCCSASGGPACVTVRWCPAAAAVTQRGAPGDQLNSSTMVGGCGVRVLGGGGGEKGSCFGGVVYVYVSVL